MKAPPLVSRDSRNTERPTGAASSSLLSKALPPACTAALSSLQYSLHNGLTTTSVTSFNTTTTHDSTASRGMAKLHTDAGVPLVWAAEGCDAVDDVRLHSLAKKTEAASFSTQTSALSPSLPVVKRSDAKLPCVGTALVALSPYAEHEDEATPLSPLPGGTSHMCCGPPTLLPREEARRATTAATFLQQDLSPHASPSPPEMKDEAPPRTLSPEEAAQGSWFGGRASVVAAAVADAPLSDETSTTRGVSSPLVGVTVSTTTTGSTTATTTARYPHHRSLPRSRSFTAQLPAASAHVSVDDLPLSNRIVEQQGKSGVHRRCLSFADRQQSDVELASPHVSTSQRNTFPATRTFTDPSDSHLGLSALTTPVTPYPSTSRGAEEALGFVSYRNNRLSPRSVSEAPAAAGPPAAQLPIPTLPRFTSMDTVATISSSRSRPALTPASTGGLPGAASSTVGSTTASTTVTSVTCTRKNVSLGALDFYGNPVTSLSTLLAQMSVRSGDRDELEQLDVRYNSQQQQHHERNTLSMQNLKAHTQQVGVMGPEDKIKRLRGRSDTVVPTTASVLRRRRSSCPVAELNTAAGSPNSAAAAAAASGAFGKPQVDCLKDVLQECKFLCINDVISAVAGTQVHELHEAQRQPVGAAVTTAVAGDAATDPGAAAAATITHAAAEALPCSPPLHPPPPQQQQQQQQLLLQSCTNHPTPAVPVVTSSPHTRVPTVDGVSSSFITASLGAGSCGSCPPVPGERMDQQQALSLAAAMTEVSLNLERGSEMPSNASRLAAASLGCVGCTTATRSRFLRAASGRTVTCSVEEATATTSSVTSGSLPNTLVEIPIDVSHTSKVATPVLLGRTAFCCFHVPPSTAEVTPISTNAGAAFPDDPLEHKILRSDSSVDAAVGATAASAAMEQPQTPLQVASAVGGSRAKSAGAAARASTSRSSRCLPRWHGLCANSEDAAACNETTTAHIAASEGEVGTPWTSPLKAPPQPQPRHNDVDQLARRIMCELSEMFDCTAIVTGGSSHKPAGASNSATEVRLVIACMSCSSFEDELTTVRELRRWAKCVALQEQLLPSTETEVMT